MASTTTDATQQQQQANIAHKVFVEVLISRPDGTSYVRNNGDDDKETQVFRGRFLEYVDTSAGNINDGSTPRSSYCRSILHQFDEGSAVQYSGAIPSLEVTTRTIAELQLYIELLELVWSRNRVRLQVLHWSQQEKTIQITARLE